jgi:hypothetical protein
MKEKSFKALTPGEQHSKFLKIKNCVVKYLFFFSPKRMAGMVIKNKMQRK